VRVLLLVAAAGFGGCHAAPPSPGAAAPGVPATTAPTPVTTPAAASASPGASATVAATPEREPPPALTVPFVREREEPVESIALGVRRVAALGSVPLLRDGERWRPLPLPPALDPGARRRVTIYMGRDDRPRLMGYSWRDEPRSASDRQPVYLRYLERGWVKAYDELGRLGGDRAGALFGVLGYDDPEVVCKEGEDCLVKRRTGWTTVTGIEIAPLRLSTHGVFALGAHGLLRLDGAGFVPVEDVAPLDGEVRDVWAVGPRDLWAIVAGPRPSRLVHVSDGAARELPSPVSEPRALWASAPNDLWLVGDGGLAWWDGERWQRVVDVPGPLSCVAGKGSETLWVGGPSGLFRRTSRPGKDAGPG
jgi:hypothetical protein